MCGIQKKSSTTFEGGVAEMKYMVTKPEKYKKFLEIRFEGLWIDDEEEQVVGDLNVGEGRKFREGLTPPKNYATSFDMLLLG